MEKCDKKNSRVQNIRTLSRMLNNLRHLLTFYPGTIITDHTCLSIFLSISISLRFIIHDIDCLIYGIFIYDDAGLLTLPPLNPLGFDQSGASDFAVERLHSPVHSLLHAEGSDARSGSIVAI